MHVGLGDDAEFARKFDREARAAARLSHPCVVSVFDQGRDDSGPGGGRPYIVMEFVDGQTLRDVINRDAPLSPLRCLELMDPVLAALAAAHDAGLVHRDVKPENVLIGHAGEQGSTVKVGDFGLVRAVHSAGTTSASVILGTVAYLSPEQVTTGAASATGDVYSAGIVLFEALTGAAPYSGDSAISVAYRHVNDDVPAPSTLVSGIPPELDDLVVRATRRDQALRPADGSAFLAEVRKLRVLLGAQGVAVPVPGPTIADRTLPVTPPVDRPGPATGGMSAVALAPAEQTVATGQPVPAAPATVNATMNATIVRPAPAGFRPIGPQGTRAMLRTDLDRANAATDFVAPAGPPSGGLPAQPPPPNRPRANRPGPPPKKKGGAGMIALWSVVAVLALALVGTTTWWFTSGRYRTVPSVAGKTAAEAEQLLTDNDLKADIQSRHSNTVANGMAIGTDPATNAEVLRGDQITLLVSTGKPKVPNVQAGVDVAEAEKQIREQDLRPDRDEGKDQFSNSVPKGKVVTTDPQPGEELEIGKTVFIVVSKGREPKPVPDVRGKSRDDAFDELRQDGFDPVEGQAAFDPDVEGGHVVSTDPEAGTKVDGDDRKVTVVLSNAVTVPDLTGRSVRDARKQLQELGLQVDVQRPLGGGEGGRVYGQDPPANSRVEANSKVTIYIFG
jgi:serine/threonine-protein kinase